MPHHSSVVDQKMKRFLVLIDFISEPSNGFDRCQITFATNNVVVEGISDDLLSRLFTFGHITTSHDHASTWTIVMTVSRHRSLQCCRTSSSEIMCHFFSDACIRTGDNRCLAEQLFVPFVLCFDEIVSGEAKEHAWRTARKDRNEALPIEYESTVDASDAGEPDGEHSHERHDLKARSRLRESSTLLVAGSRSASDHLSVDVVFIKFLQDLFSMRVSKTPMKFRETNMDDNNINKKNQQEQLHAIKYQLLFLFTDLYTHTHRHTDTKTRESELTNLLFLLFFASIRNRKKIRTEVTMTHVHIHK